MLISNNLHGLMACKCKWLWLPRYNSSYACVSFKKQFFFDAFFTPLCWLFTGVYLKASVDPNNFFRVVRSSSSNNTGFEPNLLRENIGHMPDRMSKKLDTTHHVRENFGCWHRNSAFKITLGIFRLRRSLNANISCIHL